MVAGQPLQVCATALLDAGPLFPDMYIENELLAYTSFYHDRVSSGALRSTLLAFYSPDDITAAKKVRMSPSFIGSLAAAW